MKKCPFCKSEIEASSAQCPICKRTLIEQVPSAPKRTYTPPPPPKESAEKAHTYYTPPKKAPPIRTPFKMPKGSGWIISVLGTIILSVAFSGGGHSSSNPLPPPVPAPTVDLQPIEKIPVPHAPYKSLPNGTVLYSSPSSLNGDGVLTKISLNQ